MQYQIIRKTCCSVTIIACLRLWLIMIAATTEYYYNIILFTFRFSETRSPTIKNWSLFIQNIDALRTSITRIWEKCCFEQQVYREIQEQVENYSIFMNFFAHDATANGDGLWGRYVTGVGGWSHRHFAKHVIRPPTFHFFHRPFFLIIWNYRACISDILIHT